MARAKRYTISDGKLVLTLEEAERGWYCVSSPLEPSLQTQAKSIPEAFEMARDAMNELRKYRESKSARRSGRRASA